MSPVNVMLCYSGGRFMQMINVCDQICKYLTSGHIYLNLWLHVFV